MRARHTREYSADELSLFAQYVGARAAVQPGKCHRGDKCWVKEGPPACHVHSGTTETRCVGCGGLIRSGGRWPAKIADAIESPDQ